MDSKLFLIVHIILILVRDHVERIAERSSFLRTLDNDIELRNKILYCGACTRDGQLMTEEEREKFPRNNVKKC